MFFDLTSKKNDLSTFTKLEEDWRIGHHQTVPSISQPGIMLQAFSHQLKKRGLQDVQDKWMEESVSYHDWMDDRWSPSERSWTKDSVGDVFEVLSISESCRNVTRSQQIFENFISSRFLKI